MGYWPFFNSEAASFWSILDNNRNWITNITMVYMSYARLRSIKSPKAFTDEFLLKRPILMIVCFWIFGFTVYAIILITCGTQEYTGYINYKPASMKILVDVLFWLAPLSTISILSVILWFLLKHRQKNKMCVEHKKSKFHMSSHMRFLLMMYELFFLLLSLLTSFFYSFTFFN
jgi:hypothetical protein